MKHHLTEQERRNIPDWCLNTMLCIDWVKPVEKRNCVSCECQFITDKPTILKVVV